ncbi:heterokaryon incompatibility protein-domain-containing protein [Bisporella sp. PMI_857]|nr:heterokaryon incompatibility protein-domain-containing protein [Bisporella sp. PMI_857]
MDSSLATSVPTPQLAKVLRNDQVNQKLCKYCRTLALWDWTTSPDSVFPYGSFAASMNEKKRKYIQHHPTYERLTQSCADGCPMCQLLDRGLSDYPSLTQNNRSSHLDEMLYGSIKMDDKNSSFFLLMDKAFELDGYDEFYLMRTTTDMIPDLRAPGPTYQIQVPPESVPDRVLCKPQSPRSDLTLVKGWLTSCVADHPDCATVTDRVSPTRVLEVNFDGNTNKPTVRLVETDGAFAPYVALSHCWGNFQPLCTTTQQYSAHLEGIPFDSLPKSFQDAVTVATSLGVSRLWIDSLCIIQDLVADWEQECPQMSTIYSNAVCTIAACDAANCSVGFLNDYPTELRCELGNSMTVRYIPPESMPIRSDEPSLLSTRGWVLQEKLLSPRILAFKSQRMQWQCNTHYMSDDVHAPYEVSDYYPTGVADLSKAPLKYFKHRKSIMKSPLENDKSYQRDLHLRWRQLVCNYSKRNLTNDMDKLPALSGLAQVYNTKLLNDKYLAGVWQGDLCKSLSWHRPRKWYENGGNEDFRSLTKVNTNLTYRAPSWSWASIDGTVEFGFQFRDTDDLQLRKDAAGVVAEISSKGLDPFGQVKSAVLHVRGHIIDILLHNHGLKEATCAVGNLLLDSVRDVEKFKTLENKDVSILLISYGEVDHGPKNGPILPRDDKRPRWTRYWLGLAMEKISGSENDDGTDFRRVGFVNGQDTSIKEWFKNCPWRDLRLF